MYSGTNVQTSHERGREARKKYEHTFCIYVIGLYKKLNYIKLYILFLLLPFLFLVLHLSRLYRARAVWFGLLVGCLVDYCGDGGG